VKYVISGEIQFYSRSTIRPTYLVHELHQQSPSEYITQPEKNTYFIIPWRVCVEVAVDLRCETENPLTTEIFFSDAGLVFGFTAGRTWEIRSPDVCLDVPPEDFKTY